MIAYDTIYIYINRFYYTYIIDISWYIYIYIVSIPAHYMFTWCFLSYALFDA